ncbi:hypothetical protein DCS_07327 [Drechmeria coniospora]|uniref:Uncharacterized protein n=1 Tax=Drechmeria coniospora TaxID=98403 RepID=A0A151GE44_DRECN|nr:hypothetical protein DCS_07327 [Drechmeria coniospora]KYK55364.1 hypothetical protein DCS_07327 [Drechmeria coniospora]
MGSHEFYNALARAKDDDFKSIFNVRRGDIGDAMAVLFTHDSLDSTLDLGIVILLLPTYHRFSAFDHRLLDREMSLDTSKTQSLFESLYRNIHGSDSINNILSVLSNELTTPMPCTEAWEQESDATSKAPIQSKPSSTTVSHAAALKMALQKAHSSDMSFRVSSL